MAHTTSLQPQSLSVGGLNGVKLVELDVEELNFGGVEIEAFDPDSRFNKLDPPRQRFTTRAAQANITTPAQFTAHIKAAFTQAKGLRHAGAIQAANAMRWIVNMALRDPARLSWHINRNNGVSPSSAWAYIAESRGERSHFVTAHELDATRLMMKLPDDENWNMFRGTELEIVNRELTFALYGHLITHDAEAFKAITELNGTRQLPWLVGNPDDTWLFKVRGGHKRVLPDYKCPSEPKEAGDVTDEYKTQLHLYAMKARAVQRPVEHLYIAHLYIADDIAHLWAEMLADNPKNIDQVMMQARFMIRHKSDLLKHTMSPIAIDETLIEEIVASCNAADNRVLTGRTAPWPRKNPLDITADELKAAQAMEHNIVRGIVLEKAVKEKVVEMKGDLKTILAGKTLKGAVAPLPMLGVSHTSTFDPVAAAEYLRSVNIPTKAYEVTPEVKFDADKLKAKLTELEVPLDRFSEPGMKVELTRTKKGPAIARIEELKDQAKVFCNQSFAPPVIVKAEVLVEEQSRIAIAPPVEEVMR